VAILLLILGRNRESELFVLGQITLWVVVTSAVISGVDYYRKFNSVLSAPRPDPQMTNPQILKSQRQG
jgi:hypothetical protein